MKKLFLVATLTISFFWHSQATAREAAIVDTQKILPPNPIAGQDYGRSLSADQDTLIVGAPNGNSRGWAYIYTRQGEEWVQQATLWQSDRVEDDLGSSTRTGFGSTVAIDGDTAVVSAPSIRNYDITNIRGVVFIYKRTGTTWNLEKKLYAERDLPEYGGGFGNAIAISGDKMLIGTPGYYRDSSRSSQGAVYYYKKIGTEWVFQTRLSASDDREYLAFGSSIEIDGDTAVIGAPGSTEGGLSGAGSTFVFQLVNGSWVEQQKLTSAKPSQNFGSTVDIDGGRIIIGAFNNSNHTSVYIYKKIDGQWKAEQELLNPDTYDIDLFGAWVALEGDIALVSSMTAPNMGINNSGTVYIYQREGTTWNLQTKLISRDQTDSIYFASYKLALQNSTIFATAPDLVSNGIKSGAGFIFDLQCSQSSFTLPHNSWYMFSIPCQLPVHENTVADVFGDEGLGQIGTDWAVYRYDVTSNSYVELAQTEVLQSGIGYWAVQAGVGQAMTIELPSGSLASPINLIQSNENCSSNKGCSAVTLASTASASQTQMLGNPTGETIRASDLRLTTAADTGPNNCKAAGGCSLSQARGSAVAYDFFWKYKDGGYQKVTSAGTIEPWGAYWASSMSSAFGTGPELIFPLESDVEEADF